MNLKDDAMTFPPPQADDPAPLAPQAADNGLPIQLLLFGVALLLSFLLAVAVIATVPQFDAVFRSFGAELPLATRLTVQLYPAAGALPLLVLASWFAWPRRHSRGFASLLTSIACALLVPLILGYALYLPILEMDAVVD